MGNTVYWMNVSMDLRIEHAPGEQGGGSWMRIGEELHRAFNERARQLKLMVQGRVIHETMESFWPNAATDATLDDYLFVHPVILGSGRPLFDDGSRLINCELLEQATFEGGVVMHRYAVAR